MTPKQNKPKPLPPLARTRALYDKQLPQLEVALQEIYQEIRRLLERHGFAPTIKYRVKRFDAYYDKLRKSSSGSRKNRALGDFFGLRIICPFLEDIDTIERLLLANFDITESERKSTQHSFREFGYDSVHLLLKPKQKLYKSPLPGVRNVCEIQLRTILQDAWAEVEHELVYKSDISLPNESIRRKLASLNATLTLSDLIFQEIRDYQHEIRQHGRKRRSAVIDNTLDIDLINITPDLQSGPKPIPSTLKSRLEKTMLRALEAHSNNDLETAVELYGVILGMKLETPVRALVYNHRGMAYFSQGNFPRALNDFNKAIRFEPGSERSYTNRGLCLRMLKRYEKALVDFGKALEINPESSDCYIGRAQTYRDLGETELALKDCNMALELSPDNQAVIELKLLIEQEE